MGSEMCIRDRTYTWKLNQSLSDCEIIFPDANYKNKEFLLLVTPDLITIFSELKNSPYSEALQSQYVYIPPGEHPKLRLGNSRLGLPIEFLSIELVRWDPRSLRTFPKNLALTNITPGHASYTHNLEFSN